MLFTVSKSRPTYEPSSAGSAVTDVIIVIAQLLVLSVAAAYETTRVPPIIFGFTTCLNPSCDVERFHRCCLSAYTPTGGAGQGTMLIIPTLTRRHPDAFSLSVPDLENEGIGDHVLVGDGGGGGGGGGGSGGGGGGGGGSGRDSGNDNVLMIMMMIMVVVVL